MGWRDSSSTFWLFVLSAADPLTISPRLCPLRSLYSWKIHTAVLRGSFRLLFIISPLDLKNHFFAMPFPSLSSFSVLAWFKFENSGELCAFRCVWGLVWTNFSLSNVLAEHPLFHLTQGMFGEHHGDRHESFNPLMCVSGCNFPFLPSVIWLIDELFSGENGRKQWKMLSFFKPFLI